MLVEAFFPLVLPEVIGCPEPLLAQQIVMVAHHYCTETGVWNEIQEPILTISGQSEYEIDAATSESIIVRVMDVWLDNIRLTPEKIARPSSSSGRPTGYHAAQGGGLLSLNGVPDDGQTLIVRAAYAPTLNAKTIPDILMTYDAYAVACGVKSRLMTIPGQTWSNPSTALFYKEAYENAVLDARIDMEHDNVTSSLRVNSKTL